ncbi:hypothetical protein JCGZ_00348 [Jatropha curcas]|uniref:Uncharacterized protein n=1 Tax=Jatropha curcas TaxID=180498 RepID=A0A067JGX3_JATCU|nr:hypothetical protein JCGZ_00348 [Jatropha curcas]
MLEAHRADSTGHAGDPSCGPKSDFSVGLHNVSAADYNEVCQLYEAACLKLAVARLSDEHVDWYIEQVTISSYMLCVPLYGVTMAVAYYPSHVVRQYGHDQAIFDYAQFEGGLITRRFPSRFIFTWRSHMNVPISNLVDTSSLDLYRSWL